MRFGRFTPPAALGSAEASPRRRGRRRAARWPPLPSLAGGLRPCSLLRRHVGAGDCGWDLGRRAYPHSDRSAL